MAIFTSNDLKVMMPTEIADGMISDARRESVIAKLSPQRPMRFGDVKYITFNDAPKMEYVEEGAQKSGSGVSFGAVTAKPHKGQVTLRFNEEVQWADEDYQLGVIEEVAAAGKVSLSRGLDLGMIHRINPLTGTAITSWDNYIASTTKAVTHKAKDADADLRDAVGLLAKEGKAVNGLAIDPAYSWDLASLQSLSGGQPTGTPRYPNLGFGTEIQTFMGVNTAVGDTVSARPEAKDTGIRAITGDFQNGIRWGVQRELPMEIIRFGDPDGQGDLKRRNQIAIRLEIVYGWYVFADRFAVVKVDTGTGPTV